MTFKTLSSKFNISEYDMLEVLKEAGFFEKDYSDWKPSFYEQKIVSDIDKIIDHKKLIKDLTLYRFYLNKFYFSRQTNKTDYLKMIIRDKIRKNTALVNFIQGNKS